jgi:hypothetical protein
MQALDKIYAGMELVGIKNIVNREVLPSSKNKVLSRNPVHLLTKQIK